MRDFFKHLSIYGILPVLGKFIGFFLIPIYARVFNAEEFGVLELFVSLVSLLTFACNLEFYTAIGRFFNDYLSALGRKILVSTGFWITVFISLIVVVCFFLFKNTILTNYIGSNLYNSEFLLAGIWFPLSAISTYLSVLPRYRKRSKKYVIYTSTSLLLRVSSTIFYVLVCNLGLSGVLLGHITGATTSLLFYYWDSKEYIGVQFNSKVSKKLMKFALPIVPGLLLLGAWRPLFNNIVRIRVGVDQLGYFSFAMRIVGIMAVFQAAINLTWRPLIFDSLKDKNFKDEFKAISELLSILLLLLSIGVVLLSKELILILGTADYLASAKLIGILSINWYFGIMTGIKGVGTLIDKKTEFSSLFTLIAVFIALTATLIFGNNIVNLVWGYSLFNFTTYILLTLYTNQVLNIQLFSIREVVLLSISVLSIGASLYTYALPLRIIMLTLLLFYGLFYMYKNKSILVKNG